MQAGRNGIAAGATRRLAAAGAVAALAAGALAAQTIPRPQPRPAPEAAAAPEAQPVTAPSAAAATQPSGPATPPVGSSGRPVPRFASLKAQEGNVRRGPHYDHRIDWVFVRPGMPLKITAEYEHWRRVEDADGEGGWIHYSLLSVARTVQVTEDMAELRTRPDSRAPVIARAETGVIARVTECVPDWCRISRDGLRGWLPKRALWGVFPEETFD